MSLFMFPLLIKYTFSQSIEFDSVLLLIVDSNHHDLIFSVISSNGLTSSSGKLPKTSFINYFRK